MYTIEIRDIRDLFSSYASLHVLLCNASCTVQNNNLIIVADNGGDASKISSYAEVILDVLRKKSVDLDLLKIYSNRRLRLSASANVRVKSRLNNIFYSGGSTSE